MRDDKLWGKLTQRAMVLVGHMTPTEVVSILYSYSRLKYKDFKLLEELNPIILKHLSDFTAHGLVTILAAFKKLEYRKLDTIHLIVNQFTLNKDNWTCHDIALASNAVSWFYIYQSEFWSIVCERTCQTQGTDSFTPLGVALTVSSMARVDKRNLQSLLVLARHFVNHCSNHQCSQEVLAVAINGFAKLGWNFSPEAEVDILTAVHAKSRAALALPENDRLLGRSNDTFDVQACTLLLHSLVALLPESREISQLRLDTVVSILELLSPLSQQRQTAVTGYQFRKLKQVQTVLRDDERWKVPGNCVKLLEWVRRAECKGLGRRERPRWANEAFMLLRDSVKAKVSRMTCVVDAQAEQVVIKAIDGGSAVVVDCVGPFGYYADSTILTAASRLRHRLYRLSGYRPLVIPYFEWRELKTDDDKTVYLFSRGREIARGKEAIDKPEPYSNDKVMTVLVDTSNSDRPIVTSGETFSSLD